MSDPSPVATRGRLRRQVSSFVRDRSVVAIVALWALAVAQPLLDLFGRSPGFFVANGVSRFEMILLGLVICLIGPVVLVAVQFAARAISVDAGRTVHLAIVGLLCAVLALSIQRQLEVDDAVVAGGIALLAGVGGAYAEDAYKLVRRGLVYLAFSPLLFLAAFLFTSPSADLILRAGEVDVEAAPVAEPAPVVFISLDELPLSSLLRADGTINEERFPNFARLAASGTWYRDATSMAATTELSVPSTLTGQFPDPEALPTARDHPRSLFTLLAGEYDEWVREQVTDVCPPSICPADTSLFAADRLWSAITDSAAVFGHLVAPPSLRGHLPVIDRSWGGFLDDDVEDDVSSPTPERDAFGSLVEAAGGLEDPVQDQISGVGPEPGCPDAAFWCGPARLSELADEIRRSAGGARPDLWMVHATAPHTPWILTPEGHQYLPRGLDAFAVDGLQQDNTWVDDEVPVRQAFQRHLLQVGAVDGILGDVIDALEDTGTWDDALVVVVADHGVAFTPGQAVRRPVPDTLTEIFHVPLFVKAPGQHDGRVVRTNALAADVLPTIIDLLGSEADWELDGESLAGGDHRPDKPVLIDGERSALTSGFDDVLQVVRRNRAYLPHDQDWLGVAAVGSLGDLVGRRVSQVDIVGPPLGTWRTDQAAQLADWDPAGATLAPVLLQGYLRSPANTTPPEALVAVNGTVAGVAVGFRSTNAGELSFSALLAEETLREGHNDVQLFVPTRVNLRQFSPVPNTG